MTLKARAKNEKKKKKTRGTGGKRLQEGKGLCPWPWFSNQQKEKSITIYE